MLVHSVYFWLKPDLADEDKQAFRKGLETLKDIEAAAGVHIGTPADTDRPIIDRSYDFALTVILKDMASHDTYQDHPIHQAFVEKHSDKWSRVLIYDAD